MITDHRIRRDGGLRMLLTAAACGALAGCSHGDPAAAANAAPSAGALVDDAPPGIEPSTDHLIGPVVMALQHHDGEVGTADSQADLQRIEQWHAAHC